MNLFLRLAHFLWFLDFENPSINKDFMAFLKKIGKICENHFLTMLAQLTFKRLLSNNKLFLVYKNIIKTKFVYIFLFNSFIHSSIHIYHDYGSIGFISLELFKKSLLLDSNLLNVNCASMVRK